MKPTSILEASSISKIGDIGDLRTPILLLLQRYIRKGSLCGVLYHRPISSAQYLLKGMSRPKNINNYWRTSFSQKLEDFAVSVSSGFSRTVPDPIGQLRSLSVWSTHLDTVLLASMSKNMVEMVLSGHPIHRTSIRVISFFGVTLKTVSIGHLQKQ